MTFFPSLRSIYSLDVLDSRLTTSSTTPLRNTDANITEAKLPPQNHQHVKNNAKVPNIQPSKWNTFEFYIYYLVFLTIPVLMVKSVYDVSKGTMSTI